MTNHLKTTQRTQARRCRPLWLLAALCLPQLLFPVSIAHSQTKVSDVTLEEDPFLWLEDVAGDKSLEWVLYDLILGWKGQ